MRATGLFISTLVLTLNLMISAAAPVFAESLDTGAEALVLTLAKDTIAMRSVRGEGNQSSDVAERFRQALLEGGWPSEEIEVIPFEDTAQFHCDLARGKPGCWSHHHLRALGCSGR